MNQVRYYIRVGVALVVALALLVAGVAFLRGTLTDFRTYGFAVEFGNARGIQEGAPVQMAGVQIGRVENVGLTPQNTARLQLRVNRRYPIPQNARFTISGSLLGGSGGAVLNIDPAPAPAAGTIAENMVVQGTESGGVEATIAQSQQLLSSLQRTASALEKFVADPGAQRDLRQTLRNVRAATEELPALSRTVQTQLTALSARTDRLLANLETASRGGSRVVQNAGALTGDLRATLAENRGSLRSLIENADETASALRGLAEQLNEALKGGNLQQNLAGATENLRSITARLDTVAGNVERLSSDPRLSSDIRETASNVREASASVRALTERIEGIRLPGERRPGEPRGTPGSPAQSSLLELGPTLDATYDTDVERLRVDANFTLLGTAGRFYRAGIYDFSEANRLNLQIGRVRGDTALRYGLVAGKLGGGLDVQTGPAELRFDLFNPNRLTLNARAKIRLGDTTNALLGVDSIGNGNRAVLGVQIRR
jgi:phospholipid/cholesterol/gamma-HCH transport system substrate-binding protein